MIPYVVINGVSSKNINGLLVQSLPPIKKPEMRREVEEIDGRDGDIVTSLGFSAYDKNITIGLKGDYDVDDVISYFNQAGEITFSNEIDKYYKFSQYAAIDFNKLVRYKTATVSFHVQPFKYLVGEKEIDFINENNLRTVSLAVRNNGNIYSKPTLTITGKETVNVFVNNEAVLNITLAAAGETITIDVANMNAYGEGGYMNRQVKGDYNNLILKAGHNDLIISGKTSEIKVNHVNRWI